MQSLSAERRMELLLPDNYSFHFRLRHRLDQLLWGQVPDVAIGNGQATVAQLCLNDVQRVAFVGQFKCVGMPQAVCMDAFVNLRSPRNSR